MTAAQPHPLVFNLVSRKGGTGKTTLALRLARYFALSKGRQVVILDLDFPGAAIIKGLEEALTPLSDKANNTRCLNEILVRDPLLAVPHDYFQVLKTDAGKGLCLFLGSRVEAAEHHLHKPLLEVEEAAHFFLSHYLIALRNILAQSSVRGEGRFKLQPDSWVLILDHSPGLTGISRQLLDEGPAMLADYLGLDPAGFQMYHLLVASGDRHDLADSVREFAQAYANENRPEELTAEFPYLLAINKIALPFDAEDKTGLILNKLKDGRLILADKHLINALSERVAIFLHEEQYHLFDLCNHTKPLTSLDNLPDDSSTWDDIFDKIGIEFA